MCERLKKIKLGFSDMWFQCARLGVMNEVDVQEENQALGGRGPPKYFPYSVRTNRLISVHSHNRIYELFVHRWKLLKLELHCAYSLLAGNRREGERG